MKKTTVILACLLLSAHGFAQEDYSRQISECVAALGNAVPDGYMRGDRIRYKKIGENILLKTGKGEKVAVSAFGDAFDTVNEAAEWNAQFQALFEKENWHYQDIRYDNAVYKQGDVYAVIIKPQQRDDGLTATMIMFSKTPSAFSRLQ